MRKEGWLLQQNGDRVLLIRPDATEDITNAVSMLANSDDDDEVLEAEEITFGLERDLQAALRTHIDQLEPGLRITDGGKERSTEAGRIDITATDPSGAVVVIELKAGTATPEVVAQILAYMGSVADEDNKPVRGILVAGDFHKRVILASRAISNLELRKYSFQFKFDAVS
ncbi:MAG: hypothetical protein JWM27_2586 [Gemmatimonadetes bacterium]|nr:hypothetical protein [Gemmatimonadota bacterium]